MNSYLLIHNPRCWGADKIKSSFYGRQFRFLKPVILFIFSGLQDESKHTVIDKVGINNAALVC